MSILHFSDILEKAGLDPAKVKLIRHSLGDKDFSKCYYSDGSTPAFKSPASARGTTTGACSSAGRAPPPGCLPATR